MQRKKLKSERSRISFLLCPSSLAPLLPPLSVSVSSIDQYRENTTAVDTMCAHSRLLGSHDVRRRRRSLFFFSLPPPPPNPSVTLSRYFASGSRIMARARYASLARFVARDTTRNLRVCVFLGVACLPADVVVALAVVTTVTDTQQMCQDT